MEQYPAVLLEGPRQCGKTALARSLIEREPGRYFDLADPTCPLLTDYAGVTLRTLVGTVVVDNIDRMPRLLEMIQLLSARDPLPARFLIISATAREMLKAAPKTFKNMGRVSMGGFTLDETGPERWRDLMARGRLPRSYLAQSDAEAHEWRNFFMQEMLERDVPRLGARTPPMTLRRFWQMLAHCHGQPLNASELARAMDARQDTVRRYLDILAAMFLVRRMTPWTGDDIGKRLVKAPMIYVRDSGLLHTLLGLRAFEEIAAHPRLEYSWKGFALEEALCRLGSDRDAYFYKTHAGASLDLFVIRGKKRIGFEFKFTDKPRTSKAMRAALDDLDLDCLYVVYPGTEQYALDDGIVAMPIGL